MGGEGGGGMPGAGLPEDLAAKRLSYAGRVVLSAMS